MRSIVLIDGRNLYHLARRAWASGQESPYAWPSYDVEKLALTLASRTPDCTLAETRFYTGVPDPAAGPSELFWHGFWSNKIRYLWSRGIYVYRGRVNVGGQEKGVDVSFNNGSHVPCPSRSGRETSKVDFPGGTRIAYSSSGEPTAAIITDNHAIVDYVLFQRICRS